MILLQEHYFTLSHKLDTLLLHLFNPINMVGIVLYIEVVIVAILWFLVGQ